MWKAAVGGWVDGWVWGGCAYVHTKVRATVKLSRNDALQTVKELAVCLVLTRG